MTILTIYKQKVLQYFSILLFANFSHLNTAHNTRTCPIRGEATAAPFLSRPHPFRSRTSWRCAAICSSYECCSCSNGRGARSCACCSAHASRGGGAHVAGRIAGGRRDLRSRRHRHSVPSGARSLRTRDRPTRKMARRANELAERGLCRRRVRNERGRQPNRSVQQIGGEGKKRVGKRGEFWCCCLCARSTFAHFYATECTQRRRPVL